jgi:hypothetical protein
LRTNDRRLPRTGRHMKERIKSVPVEPITSMLAIATLERVRNLS